MTQRQQSPWPAGITDFPGTISTTVKKPFTALRMGRGSFMARAGRCPHGGNPSAICGQEAETSKWLAIEMLRPGWRRTASTGRSSSISVTISRTRDLNPAPSEVPPRRRRQCPRIEAEESIGLQPNQDTPKVVCKRSIPYLPSLPSSSKCWQGVRLPRFPFNRLGKAYPNTLPLPQSCR
jgi:hypothetical protein